MAGNPLAFVKIFREEKGANCPKQGSGGCSYSVNMWTSPKVVNSLEKKGVRRVISAIYMRS